MNDFVNWFSEVLPQIFESKNIQIEMSRRLEEIDSRIRWEAGPYDNTEDFFAFSPNFHKDLLIKTERLAKSIPKIPGWNFLGAKPRKKWATRKIFIKNKEYYFDNWRYRLVLFEGSELFDIDFFSFDDDIDEDIKLYLGVFLASSELGEKLFMKSVDRVDVKYRPKEGESSIDIKNLFDQIVELSGNI